MPRRDRLFLPGQPLHVVKRGHNRDPIVRRKIDCATFVELLGQAVERYDLALHAWVLMTNHMHLLATPAHDDSLPRAMQWLGSHYARYFNKCYRRSGSVWEGRYRSSLIDTDRYLLLCYRYIELNPVRAGLVSAPEQYPWSSYRFNAWGREWGQSIDSDPVKDSAVRSERGQSVRSDPELHAAYGRGLSECSDPARGESDLNERGLSECSDPAHDESVSAVRIAPHEIYLALGQNDRQRNDAYRGLFNDFVDAKMLLAFRQGIARQQPVGNSAFLLRVARMRNCTRGLSVCSDP